MGRKRGGRNKRQQAPEGQESNISDGEVVNADSDNGWQTDNGSDAGSEAPSIAYQFRKYIETTTSPRDHVGMPVNEERDRVHQECREKVERIAKECKAGNKRFRDTVFDLEGDPYGTFHGLNGDPSQGPKSVKRVSEIWEQPKFFVDGPDSSDIAQGALGDCWFLSALSTVSTTPEYIYRCCAARDEEVGVFGFIFFRDGHWINVITDDQLFWFFPKFEELAIRDQALYHNDKKMYETTAIKGGKGLYCAQSGTAGETWVPLLEKAAAKAHGDFMALVEGSMSEGVEDVTGGVSVMIHTRDILDTEKFWNEELLHANDHTRLFGVSFGGLDVSRSGGSERTVQGLFGAHAYSVLRVKEFKGKKFVLLRNPWGKSEWTGAWADGSKEWKGEWFQLLDEIDHVFGDDGQFVMEYSDFLQTWSLIQRTTIFDDSWIMSSHWLKFSPPSTIHPFTYGDLSFKFSLSSPSKAVIVLSKLDDRYFRQIEGLSSVWSFEFSVYKRGDKDYIGRSQGGIRYERSVTCELELEEGEYIVFPRLDRRERYLGAWSDNKRGRVLAKRTEARALAANYDLELESRFLPQELKDVIEADLQEFGSAAPLLSSEETVDDIADEEVSVVPSTGIGKSKKDKRKAKKATKKGKGGKGKADHAPEAPSPAPGAFPPITPGLPPPGLPLPPPPAAADASGGDGGFEEGEEDLLFIGLRVYTKEGAVSVITGKVRDYS